MTTNTVQLHKKVRYWLDQSRSPRFLLNQIDDAINNSIDDIMKERFIPESPQDSERGFQRTRVLRDELRPLVKKVSTSQRSWTVLAHNGIGNKYSFVKGYYYRVDVIGSASTTDITNLIAFGAPSDGGGSIVIGQEFEANATGDATVTAADMQISYSICYLKLDSVNNVLLSEWLPSDYNYYALIRLTVNNMLVDPFEITYEQKAMIDQDPFLRPSIDYPAKTYHFESNEGFKFEIGDRGIITNVELFYLSYPVKVKYGKEKVINTVSEGTSVILGQNEVTQNDVYYEFGDAFTVPATPNPATTIVITGTVNSDMPESLVNEIAKRAAKNLLLIVERSDKAQSLS